MQSEEEIINNIKTMLEKNDEIFDEIGTNLYFSKSTAEVIKGLLDLYYKEYDENVHWKASYYKLSRKIDVITKDKIREKLNYQYILWNTPNRQKEYNQELVEVLEELLEDTNE